MFFKIKSKTKLSSKNSCSVVTCDFKNQSLLSFKTFSIYININRIVSYFVTWAEQAKRIGDAGMPGVEENDLAKVDDLPAGK